jgi:hypothetical protein
MMALTGSAIAVEGVQIFGDCEYDANARTTNCKYTIYGELLYDLTVYFPIPPNCIECVTFTSEFMYFVGPQQWSDSYGYRSSEFDLPPGAEVTFLVSYDGQEWNGNQFQTVRLEYEGQPLDQFDVPAMELCAWEASCEFAFDATAMSWALRKPGYYASRWANATLEANVAMSVQFEGFANLIDQDGDEIAIWHGIAEGGAPNPPSDWMTPTEFNARALTIDAETEMYDFSLWTRVQTTIETSVGEYYDEGTITLVLENNQPYVDLGIKSEEHERRTSKRPRTGERK